MFEDEKTAQQFPGAADPPQGTAAGAAPVAAGRHSWCRSGASRRSDQITTRIGSSPSDFSQSPRRSRFGDLQREESVAGLIRVRPSADAGVEGIDAGEVFAGEFEVEN